MDSFSSVNHYCLVLKMVVSVTLISTDVSFVKHTCTHPSWLRYNAIESAYMYAFQFMHAFIHG